MKPLILIFIAWPMLAQTMATITETSFRQTQQSQDFRGKISVTPALNCRLTRGGASFARTRRVYCIGITGNDCDTTTASGVVNIEIVPTGAGTFPQGCYYIARIEPIKGDADTETWVIPNAQSYQIKDVRATVAPSPSAIVRLSQILDTTSGTGCLQKNSDGTVTPTGQACGTGSGGSGLPPTNATWSTVTGTWGTNNRPWSAQ